MIVCQSPLPALCSLPLFISLFVWVPPEPLGPFQVPVYEPCPLCPGLVCETRLSKPFGVRWVAVLTVQGTRDFGGGVTGCVWGGWSLERAYADGLGFCGGGGRGSGERGPEPGWSVGGGTEVGAQDRISPCPSFLFLSAASPGAATAAASVPEADGPMFQCSSGLLSTLALPAFPMCGLTPFPP